MESKKEKKKSKELKDRIRNIRKDEKLKMVLF
jgi:hypothetical protein